MSINEAKQKTCFFPCTHAMTVLTERWLSKQASEGWKLYRKTICFFTFIPAKESRIEYFMYSSFGNERGLSYDYLRAKERYAKTKAHINKTESSIFEADPNKIDDEFYQYRAERNRYYRKYYLWAVILLCIFAIIAVISTGSFPPAKYLLALLIPMLLYYSVSLVIMLCWKEK